MGRATTETCGPNSVHRTPSFVASPSTRTVSCWRRGGAELEAIARAPGRVAILAFRHPPKHLPRAEGDGPSVERVRRETGELAPDQPGVHVGALESRMRDQRMQEGGIGLRPGDDRRRQRAGEHADRRLAIGTAADQLGDHRIVEGRNDRTALHARVDAQTRQALRLELDDAPDRRQKSLGRVLGVEPRLDGMARHGDLALRQRQLLAGRHPQLPLHEIEAR